jgi:hypothetical protein
MEGIQGDAKGLTRREALKRGIAVGSLVWAVPLVQAVGMRPAYAHTTSGDCHRFCLKWTPGGPSGTTCPPTHEGELPAEDALIGFTGSWERLGGRPDKGPYGTSEVSTTSTAGDEVANGPAAGQSESGSGGDANGLDSNGLGTSTTVDSSGDSQNGGADQPESKTSNGPPHKPPGNCLECPPDAINDVPRGLDKQVAVYQLPTGGFLFTYPSAWNVTLSTGVAKCGSEQSSQERTSPCGQEASGASSRASLCGDSLSGFEVASCFNGHAISHVELILDICQ